MRPQSYPNATLMRPSCVSHASPKPPQDVGNGGEDSCGYFK